MKRIMFVMLLGLVFVNQSSAQKPTLTPAFADAAIAALNEWNDAAFHAFHIARDSAAKTSADKLTTKRLEAFLLIHHLDFELSHTMFADAENRHALVRQEECREQWRTNLRYRDAAVPAVCGLKF
jgi:hypothetical protein